MAMSRDVLASQLLALVPVATEAEAVAALTDAYGEFASDAEAGVPITGVAVNAGKAAMRSALVGVSSPGAGASVITAAVQAFWAAVASGLSGSFPGATAIAPPPNAGLQALLAVTFAANTAAGAPLADAASAIATDLHNQAIIGGGSTFPGPSVVPIT